MERYLQPMGPKPKSKGPGKTPKSFSQHIGNTEDVSLTSTRDNSPPPMAGLECDAEMHQNEPSLDYKRLATEVARQISPDIQETLAKTVTTMLSKIQSEVVQHDQRLDELEFRLQSLETEAERTQEHLQKVLQDNKRLGEKVEDLENRSRRNNLCILGIPESVPQKDLMLFCEQELPTALGLPHRCKVERAHRLGPDLRPDKTIKTHSTSEARERPRQVMVKYLDYTDKTNILCVFKRLKEGLNVRGHKILISGDFSAEVVQKRRAFSPLCSTLCHRQICFALLYPAILRVFHGNGPFSIHRLKRRRH